MDLVGEAVDTARAAFDDVFVRHYDVQFTFDGRKSRGDQREYRDLCGGSRPRELRYERGPLRTYSGRIPLEKLRSLTITEFAADERPPERKFEPTIALIPFP